MLIGNLKKHQKTQGREEVPPNPGWPLHLVRSLPFPFLSFCPLKRKGKERKERKRKEREGKERKGKERKERAASLSAMGDKDSEDLLTLFQCNLTLFDRHLFFGTPSRFFAQHNHCRRSNLFGRTFFFYPFRQLFDSHLVLKGQTAAK